MGEGTAVVLMIPRGEIKLVKDGAFFSFYGVHHSLSLSISSQQQHTKTHVSV